MTQKVPTGCSCIDEYLEGGVTPRTITMLYGEPETGKTTFAIQCAANCAIQLKLKTLFVDCDNTFATERLSQITQERFAEAAEQIILMKPKDFSEQTLVVDNITDYIRRGFGLVVIDTFNSLYRARMAETATKAKASFAVNRELNRQMALLAETAKTQHVPVIVTSQVRAKFDDPYVSVLPVATRVLQFWADTTIALKPAETQQVIKADIKNRNAQEVTCYLRITQTGIHDNPCP
ncbi:MAG: AAA family ATPase [Candidatus Bathyarchaeota archaeon]|nr:AAA family ATPase [Candidatus Bathyarchaeota archaeon]